MAGINYDWVPFYEEFAQKLLTYIDDRTTLIKNVVKAFDALDNMKLPKLEDEGELEDIDPFTIYSLFNRGITEENRKNIIAQLKSVFNIKADVPSMFDGIPIANNVNAAFYYFKSSERASDAIENLWKLFKATLNLAKNDTAENRSDFSKYYDIVMKQPKIARAKLTNVFLYERTQASASIRWAGFFIMRHF